MPQKPPIQKLGPNQHLDPKISDEQIDLIGRVVISFSKLEAALEDTIWFFLKIDEEDGRIVTKRLDAEFKIQMLRALAARHITDAGKLSEFNKLLTYIGEIKDGRNFIVHGVWATMMPDAVPVALSLKPKADPGVVVSESFPRDRMIALAAGNAAAIKKLVDLPAELGSSPHVAQ